MINLLAPETKRQLRAARTNVTLLRYCALLIFTAGLLAGVFTVGFWADLNDRKLANDTKAANETAALAYQKTHAAAESFAKDLEAAKTILATNVSFSDLIFDIAALVPQGVILNNLALSANATTATPIDITGRATSYGGAISLKNNLEASDIFEKVNIVNVNQADPSTLGDASTLVKKYPYTVSIKAQFSKPAQGAKK